MSEIDVFLTAGEVVRTDGLRLFRTRVNGTDEQYVNPLATEDGMPGYAVQWIEIEGPFDDDSAVAAGYERLFGPLPLVPSEPSRGGISLEVGPSAPGGPGPAPGAGPSARQGREGPARRPARGAL